MARAGTPLSEQRPDHRQVSDVYSDAGFPGVPQHVAWRINIRKIHDLSENGGYDDEYAKAEKWYQDELLSKRELDVPKKWEWN